MVKTIIIQVMKVGNQGIIPKIAKMKIMNRIMEVIESKWVLSIPSLLTRILIIIFILLLLVMKILM